MGKFVLKRAKNEQFYFTLVAGNGEVILKSEMYTTKGAAFGGISSVKENAPDDARYERLKSSSGKHYFNLKAKNHQVIGTSEMYESESARDNGIASVAKNAPDAGTDDQTA
ncbi:MAG: YegP family protein [Phycisphaerales bacterium]